MSVKKHQTASKTKWASSTGNGNFTFGEMTECRLQYVSALHNIPQAVFVGVINVLPLLPDRLWLQGVLVLLRLQRDFERSYSFRRRHQRRVLAWSQYHELLVLSSTSSARIVESGLKSEMLKFPLRLLSQCWCLIWECCIRCIVGVCSGTQKGMVKHQLGCLRSLSRIYGW